MGFRSERGRWRWVTAHEWDRVVDSSPGATGFHSRAWCEALAQWDERFAARALGLELASGELVLVPLCVRRGALRRGVFARAVSSHPNTYGGPLLERRHLGPDDWREFVAALQHAPLGRLECFGNPLEPLPGLADDALKTRVSRTRVIELRALPQDVLSSYESSCRRAVRKATQSGVVVQRERGAAALDDYFACYRDSLRRWGKRDGYPKRLFEALLDVPGLELWCARTSDGRLAAGGLFLFTREHCVYWHGALLEELAPLRPSNALHHALILAARERGLSLYDFNPSSGLDGVEEFKAKFGAQPLEVRAWRHRHKLARLLGG